MHQTPFLGRCRFAVTDIDYTFVNSDKQMLPANLEALRKAREAGVDFAFATGRCWNSVKGLVQQLELTAPQIVDNGAAVFDPVTGSVLNSRVLKEETARFLYDGLLEAGFTPTYCTAESYYNVAPDAETLEQHRVHGEPTVLLDSHEELLGRFGKQAVKVGVSCIGREEYLKRVLADLRRKASERGLDFLAVFTEPAIVVITAAGVCKMTGVDMAIESMGLERGEVAAIGDGDNDSQMLSCCGLGFAVGNASGAAKAAASYVVASCDQAGFAEAVGKILELNGAGDV